MTSVRGPISYRIRFMTRRSFSFFYFFSTKGGGAGVQWKIPLFFVYFFLNPSLNHNTFWKISNFRRVIVAISDFFIVLELLLYLESLKSQLGEHSKKKMSQIGERVHKGGGVKSKIKKFYISNIDYFDQRGGAELFTCFPNVNIMKTIRLLYYYGNFPNFNFFPNQVRGGAGGHQISFFPQIQNSPHYPK